ncbi:MAG: sensor domain-containing diguanylate cyclase [Spirochaetaceae bacterium]|nr:sensor domain-containing diguanylate cyclase [Spirochaetaceae bacterium]
MTGANDDAFRLRSLLDIAKVVSSTRRFDDLVEATAESARRSLDAASLSISRWDRESGVLRTLVNVGMLCPGETRFPDDETYSLAAWPDLAVLVEDRLSFLATVGDGSAEGGLLAQMGRDSSLSVPIIVESRTWGELWAARVAGQPRYLEEDLDFAEAVAVQIGAAVVQADHLARVERLAFTDPLTGLANRRAVDERLDLALADHRATKGSVSVILADINRLKQVNDTFGHEAGDRLIVSVAAAVSRASGLARDAMAARIGGDEFCVVISGEPLATAVLVAEELCRLVDTQPMSTGISCGVASTEVLSGPVDSAVRLFRLADAAQYRAKRAGSRHPVVAGRSAPEDEVDAGEDDRRVRRGRLSTDVQAALESGLALLDAMPDDGVKERLEQVADHVRDILDAAAWWLSGVAPGAEDLVTLNSSVQRAAEQVPGMSGGFAEVGLTFDLRDYPLTRRAIEGAGSFAVEVGMPGNDAAEEATLVSAGYHSMLAAGASDAESGWLVEVYADHISLPMAAFEPVLRALVAIAVAGVRRSGGEPDDEPAVPHARSERR